MVIFDTFPALLRHTSSPNVNNYQPLFALRRNRLTLRPRQYSISESLDFILIALLLSIDVPREMEIKVIHISPMYTVLCFPLFLRL